MRGDGLDALERGALSRYAVMPVARKVWKLASPSPTAATRRLVIRNTSTRLIRRAPIPLARGIERHRGDSYSAAIPAASR